MQMNSLKRPNKHLQELLRPFSYQECLIHSATSKLGEPIEGSECCKCCGLPYQKQPIPPSFQASQIFYLGKTLSLYFQFIRICIWLAVFLTLIYSLVVLYFNTSGDSYSSFEFLVYISFCNKLNNISSFTLQYYLAYGMAIFLMGLLIFSYIKIKELEETICQKPSEKDYAVVLTLRDKVWERRDIAQGIREWWEKEDRKKRQVFQKVLPDGDFPIQSIIVFYQISDLKKLEKRLNSLQIDLENKALNHKRQQIQQKINKIKINIRNKHLLRTNKCLVLLKYATQAKFILQSHSKIFMCCTNRIILQNQVVKVSEPSLPESINWENQENFKIKCVRGCILLLLLCISAAFQSIVFLLVWTFRQYSSYIIILPLISIVSLLFCYIIMKKCQKFEGRADKLQQGTANLYRFSLFVFLNASLLPIISIVLFSSKDICSQNGPVNEISELILVFTVMSAFLPFLNYRYLFRCIRLVKLKHSNHKSISQMEANQLCELPQVDLAWRCSVFINWSWSACYLVAYIPVASICFLMFIMVFLLCEKYAFVKLNRQRKSFGNELNNQAFNLLKLCPAFIMLGSISLRNTILIMKDEAIICKDFIGDFTMLALCILFIFIPIEYLSDLCVKIFSFGKQKNHHEQLPYSQAQIQFKTTYQQQNPAYQKLSNLKNKATPQSQFLSRTLSTVLRSSNQLDHPIKGFRPPSEQQSFSYSQPDVYTPRIQRRQTIPKIVPKLSIKKTKIDLSDTIKTKQVEMVDFMKVCDEMNTKRRQIVGLKLKSKVQKLTK